jgi:hypothetical protein
MPLERPFPTPAPETKRVAIEPIGRDMRFVEERLAMRERAPLEEVLFVLSAFRFLLLSWLAVRRS